MPNSANTIGGIASEISKHPCVTYLDDVQLSDNLISGSMKNAAVVACSDMGTWVPYVCSSPSVKLFLFQNFGHQFECGGIIGPLAASGKVNLHGWFYDAVAAQLEV